MKRTALDALDIAARAKAHSGGMKAAGIDVPLNINKLGSIIAVANLKGGVGKSTIAVNLACELAVNQTVVVVDADAQETATAWASHGKLGVAVEPMPLDSGLDAASWVEGVLNIEADHIVIDCPPHVGPATYAAVGIADIVLVPVTPSGADLVAASPALDLLSEVKQARRDGGPLCMLVPTKVDRRTAAGREIEAALAQFDQPVAPSIGQRTAFVDSFGAGVWIGRFAPRSPAREEIHALTNAVKRRWLMELKKSRQAAAVTGVQSEPPLDAGGIR